MKIKIGILALLLTNSIWAQQKETVHSIIVELHETSWYKTQQKLWGDETVSNDKNVDAWMNFYSATRALRILSEAGSEEHQAYLDKCAKIAKDAYKSVPETFEGNYIVHWDGGLEDDKFKYLLKAYEIDPSNPMTYDALMTEYELKRDMVKVKEMCLKMYEANSYPPGLMSIAYNVLAELDENAVIFTGGDNDTYPLWIVQHALGFRKDVTVLNTYLAKVEGYAPLICAEIGLPTFKYDQENKNDQELYDHFFKNTKGIPVYAISCSAHQFKAPETYDNFYLTGLAYRYSEENIDNLSLIRRNFEKRYLLDYLKVKTSNHIADERANVFAGFYINGLIKLYSQYKLSEEIAKMNELLELLEIIGERTGKGNDIEKLLEGC